MISEKIKLVVAAGGDGTRMNNITKGEPKSLLDFNGRPLISYQLEMFKELGIEEVLLSFDNKKHFAIFDTYIEENRVPKLKYFYGLHSPFEHPGKLFCEKDTKEFINGDNFFYTQGDLLFEKKLLIQMFDAFEKYKCLILRKGSKKANDKMEYICYDNFITSKKIVEAGNTTWREGGLYLVPKEIQSDWLETFDVETPMTINLLNKMVEKKNKIYVVDYNGIFINMNTEEEYNKAKEFLDRNLVKV